MDGFMFCFNKRSFMALHQLFVNLILIQLNGPTVYYDCVFSVSDDNISMSHRQHAGNDDTGYTSV